MVESESSLFERVRKQSKSSTGDSLHQRFGSSMKTKAININQGVKEST